MVPDRGPDSVGPNQGQRQILLAPHAIALNDCQPLGVRGHVLELAAKPQLDVVMLLDLGLQRGLQIGAVHHPVGCVVTNSGLPERQASDLAVALHAHQADCIGADRARGEPRLQSERNQHTAGIRRELDTGPDFLEALGFLQNDNAKSPCRERQRSRQSSDSGTSNEDGARGCHRWVRLPCPLRRIRAGGPRRA